MEVLFFLAGLVGLFLWFRCYRALFKSCPFHRNKRHRTLFAALPFLCTAFITVVLWFWSSPDVRFDAGWMALYVAGGTAWLQLGLFLLSLLGVGARDDVIERQNPAAAWVVYGAMTGTTLCYAGSNMGSGPGAEAVIFCAAVSTAFLFGFWFLLERIFRLADQITIDRNESAGIRVGGWISGLGLIFGAAVAGDWVSLEATIWDFFRYAWVAIPFLLVAITIEWALRSSQLSGKRHRASSVAVAIAYFLAAAIYVSWRGAR
jgi:uncharacterized membrane protein YjfL (UPF0719 family)